MEEFSKDYREERNFDGEPENIKKEEGSSNKKLWTVTRSKNVSAEILQDGSQFSY